MCFAPLWTTCGPHTFLVQPLRRWSETSLSLRSLLPELLTSVVESLEASGPLTHLKHGEKKNKTKHQSSLHGAVFITDFFTECVPQLQMCTSGLFLGGRWGCLWVAAPGRLGKITTGGKTVRSDRKQKWHMNFWVSCITFESPGGSLPQEHPLVFEHLSGPHHILLAEGVSALQLSCAAVLHAIKDFL